MGLTTFRYRLYMSFAATGLASAVLATGKPAAAQAALAEDQSVPEKADTLDALGPLDPDQPLTEFPDFGVDWPDLDAAPSGPDQSATEAKDTAQQMDSDRRLAEEKVAEVEDAGVRAEANAELEAGAAANFRPTDALAEREYSIGFAGLPADLDGLFDERFDALSSLAKYSGEKANFAQIKRRAETDKKLVERLLRIEGYYDAIVRSQFSEGSSQAIAVTINVTAGPQYRLDAIRLAGIEKAQAEDAAQLRKIFALQSWDVINSDVIALAQARLDRVLAESGYAFAETEQPELVIDHAERAGDLDIVVAPGGKFNFGRILMQNSDLFGPEHAALIARFDAGELYKQTDVEDLRRALIATGLVSTVTLQPVISPTDPNSVDIATTITAAPLRTISGAVGYGTGEGLRSEISWEHRNFFPPEGLIRLTGVLATQEQSGSITYRRNNFRRRDNVLNGQVALSNIDRSAFEARTFSVSANLERQSNLIFQKKWNWSAGIELLASQERDSSGDNQTTSRDTFFIGALPATLAYDGSDNLLDPSEGFRLSARISPEASLQSGSFFYVRTQLDGSAYYPVSNTVTLAGRTRFGSIVGAGRNRIAPSRRLYAGGGGSVRGFGFQRIGPRDANNDPAGGRSLAEFSLEARVRLDILGGNFGVVPFVDAGNVYTKSLPDLSSLRVGAGLGIRYYSDFGPIRVDVGTPINPQEGDAPVAVYVSLGQAF
ncbi:MAG: BamA/TamA family outer membrane protein [Parasphingorhabdus sp.]|uniref:autotransporter assembly complex protein TamA n=1 Tax=Parasphingorhabdus sp. TaxID=2709688 RepID=UPI0032996FCF